MAKPWSEEEVTLMQEKWGTSSIKKIATELDRTVTAVKLKAQREGLGDAREHYDGITLGQLCAALGVSYSTATTWMKKYKIPVKSKVFAEKHRVRVITYGDFWKWAEKNKQLLDFSRMEPLTLGAEPEWVREKRRADALKMKSTPWTREEEQMLISMTRSQRHTYQDIAKHLNRTEGAIRRRLAEIGIDDRPAKVDNHVKYTQEELDYVVEMIKKGYSLDVISRRIGKSALGVRGKLERMGYRFMGGTPIIESIKA